MDSTVTDQHREEVVGFALGALAGVHISLLRVLAGSFWRLAWCSALFVAVIGWDLAADEVGWLESLWVAVLPVLCVLVLRGVAYQWFEGGGDAEQQQLQVQRALKCDEEGGILSLNPLHVT